MEFDTEDQVLFVVDVAFVLLFLLLSLMTMMMLMFLLWFYPRNLLLKFGKNRVSNI